jgi:hypothetical protein
MDMSNLEKRAKRYRDVDPIYRTANVWKIWKDGGSAVGYNT